MSMRISRQHWQGLLGELEAARQQRHLVTYRALIERLQLPTPAMQTLVAALEHLAALDARAEQPLRSALVISQGASRLPRPGFSNVPSAWVVSRGLRMVWRLRPGILLKWCAFSSTTTRRPHELLVVARLCRLSAGALVAAFRLAGASAACLAVDAGTICTYGCARLCSGAELLWTSFITPWPGFCSRR